MKTKVMNNKSLEMLEFPRVRQIIAGYANSDISKELISELKPLNDIKKIKQLLEQSAEARRLLAVEHDFRPGIIEDIREIVGIAGRGKTLDAENLAAIVSTLTTIKNLKSSLRKISLEYPLIWEIAASIADLNQVEKSIRQCISPSGELLDTASPELQAIRFSNRPAQTATGRQTSNYHQITAGTKNNTGTVGY